MKDLIISKELIKAVLQKETETLSKDFNFIINEDYIEFSDDGEIQFEYCIYKFAFKCKEWAFKRKTNMLLTEFCINNDNLRDYHDKVDCRINIGYYNKKMEHCRATFTDKTEFKALFKACECILTELNETR